MPDGMKHSRTEPLLRDSDTPQSGSASGGHAVRKAPPTPDNHAQLEKAVSDRFTDPQDFELFMLAIEGPQNGVWDWNIERDTLYLSDRHLEILGYGKSEISIGPAEWVAMFHPEDVPTLREALVAYYRGETETYSCEIRVQRKDGSWS